ncbi:helix-turn-helix transcriptional regulator [Shinella zoogloeoides]|uniref:LexA family transcriptional regulator n=1 Tax=Shinella zoogloeoides TaxID=352475 RepID=UPI0028A6B0C1|nr:S24 family peptidase [Shinella zoogloeoides]
MQQHERLKEARLEAGYKTASEAALATGANVATYIGHENGNRRLTVSTAERYASAFNVRASWLLTGEMPKHYASWEAFDGIQQDNLAPAEAWGRFRPGRRFHGTTENSVAEIDPFTAGAETNEFEVTSAWSFPTDYITNTLQLRPENICLVTVPDDSAAPTLSSGDRAIVDAGQTTFRGDGIYAIRDEDGQIHLRHLTKVIFKKAPDQEIAVATEKPSQWFYARQSDIEIFGKVVGRVGKI